MVSNRITTTGLDVTNRGHVTGFRPCVPPPKTEGQGWWTRKQVSSKCWHSRRMADPCPRAVSPSQQGAYEETGQRRGARFLIYFIKERRRGPLVSGIGEALTPTPKGCLRVSASRVLETARTVSSNRVSAVTETALRREAGKELQRF